MTFTRAVVFLSVAASLGGCASWGVLPSTTETTQTPFQTYRSAEDAFNQVKPFVTTTRELKARGFDPYTTPNIRVLNYLDLLPRFLPQQSMKADDLDPAVQACLTAREKCQGWLAEPSISAKDRTGNVALDVLGFERETTSTGWKASMLLLVQNGVVTRDDVLPEARPTEAGSVRTGRTLADVVDGAERQAIEGALRDCDGSREKAAELLGISATTLWRKMTRLGIVYEAHARG